MAFRSRWALGGVRVRPVRWTTSRAGDKRVANTFNRGSRSETGRRPDYTGPSPQPGSRSTIRSSRRSRPGRLVNERVVDPRQSPVTQTSRRESSGGAFGSRGLAGRAVGHRQSPVPTAIGPFTGGASLPPITVGGDRDGHRRDAGDHPRPLAVALIVQRRRIRGYSSSTTTSPPPPRRSGVTVSPAFESDRRWHRGNRWRVQTSRGDGDRRLGPPRNSRPAHR